MSLWMKALDTITWQDVLDFCAVGYTEGVRVDYKAQMPGGGVARHVAAFANTLGGLLLIGVKANATTGKPILPVTGMVIPRGITEQIDQQCLDGIYPPLLPETRIIDDPATPGTGVVLVRVEESVQAPHAIQNSTQIYIRKDDHSRPEELGTLDWVEHLLARRRKPEAVRERLRAEAIDRVSRDATAPFITAVVSPKYPMAALQPERFVLDWALKQDRQNSAWPVRPRAGGVSQTSESRDGRLHRYNEFHSNGFFFAAAPLPVAEGDGRYMPTKYVDQQMLFYELSLALREGQQFLKAIGFHGLAAVEATVSGVRGHGLYWANSMPPGNGVAADPTASAEAMMMPPGLFSADTAVALLNEIRWAMGYEARWQTGHEGVKGIMESVLRARPG